MPRSLLLTVRFHDGRYHGTGDWPPAPARLFQALVAGAACGGTLAREDRAALAWLETLAPPLIAAPAIRAGQALRNYVPNNDLDAVGGDPARISEIRAPKRIKPLLFDAAGTLLYAWNFNADNDAQGHADGLTNIARRLYQLGRGVDMAWATADVLDQDEVDTRLRQGGVLHQPSEGGKGATLLCPQPGTLKSLEDRFRASRKRFSQLGKGRKSEQLFSQPPKPRFGAVLYNSPPAWLLFDIRASESKKAEPDFAPWPLVRAVKLVEKLRDAAVEKLKQGLPPTKFATIERFITGRDATEADKAQRVRIMPLPSIGHGHADHAIRRLLIEVPANCPIAVGDIRWAFSDLSVASDAESGEVFSVLTPADSEGMLSHYGIGRNSGSRLWHTITPAALPQAAARRRIDPCRLRDRREWKGAPERAEEDRRASAAVMQALRHADITTKVAAIGVRREPFTVNGERAEFFAPETRFAKERLWHVEIAFVERVNGPIAIGDGRYLGVGVMAPVRKARRGVVIFDLPPQARVAEADRTDFLRAARRALMALSRENSDFVPPLFSGHEANGAPARSGRHEHIFLAGADLDRDERIEHLIVAAPWVCDRSVRPDRGDKALFDRVVSSLAIVRAGRLGVVPLQISAMDSRLVGPSQVWESHTVYRPTRHAERGKETVPALLRDVIAECERRGLPRAKPELLDITIGAKGGVASRLRLRFAVAVAGPILLGNDSHKGGGLFAALD